MDDRRCPLHPNHLLTLELENSTRKYRLHGKPITGGSSLVYKARLENDITADFFMVKEFHPIIKVDEDTVAVMERTPNGRLEYPDNLHQTVEILKERAKREAVIVNELRHGEGSTNNDPWFLSYSNCIDANNTLYTVIATESGDVLSERIDRDYFKTFEEVCNCGLRILDALEPIHKKGYLHLDIAPDNIHFSDTKIARLIDFNSACRQDEPLERLILSFKEGYSAKELYRRTSAPTTATDLFSVAAIVFYMLMGRAQGDDDRTPNIRHLDSESGILKGSSELLVRKTNDFLTKGIAHSQRLRFQSVPEMREAVEELKRLKIEIDLVNTPSRVKSNKFFVCRQRDILQIENALSRDNYVFLEGIGGIGKTELAKSFAWEKNYDIVQFVNFGRNLQETVARELMFHNFNAAEYEAKFGGEAIKYIFRDKIARLIKCAENGQRILIIIDNYSDTSAADFKLFTSGKYHVIFTTREKLGGMELSQMDRDSLLELFCKYYAPCVIPPTDLPVVRDIIDEVGGHTMTIMLAATAMQKKSISLSAMYERLLYGDSIVIQADKEWLEKDKREQIMIQHILTLFDMTQIKQDEKFTRIMVNMAVAPEAGIEKKEFFHTALQKFYDRQENFADLDWLRDIRWIQEHGDTISLHAVIADVASYELKPDSVKCGDFVSSLILSAFGDTQVTASAAANRLKTACRRITDETPLTRDLYFRYAKLSSFLADYTSALTYYEKIAVLNEKALGADNPTTATAFNNIGMILHKKGDCIEALKWYEKAVDALMKSPDDNLHATLYNNIAAIHNAHKDYPLALTCYENALKIYAEMHGYEHPDTAMTVNNIAVTYLHQKNYDQAKAWFTKAVTLREKAHGKDHPATATTYGNIALACYEQGKYVRALEWGQKALEIRESKLGKEHPETAGSYNTLGLAHAGLGENDKALEFLQKALEINEKVLGKKHPNTIEAYRNLRTLEISTQ